MNASVSYDRTDNNPHHVIDANLLFPIILLDLASKNNVKIFINTDSYFTYMQYDRMKNYTLSKRQFKDWLFMYSDRMKIFNLVLMHIYGERDNPEKFIPFVIKSILSGEKEIKLTSGIQKKDFIFIDDLCLLFIHLLKSAVTWPHDYYEYIVGSGHLTSIREVVEIIKSNIYESKTVLNFGGVDNSEEDVDKVIKADLERLKTSFNWQPVTTIGDGLAKTINYYRSINEK